MPGLSLIESAAPGDQGRFRASDLAAGFQRSYLLWLLGLVAAYYATAHLGFAFQFAGPVAAVVWLPAGVGMAFLYLGGLRLWPGVVIGDLLVNNYSTLPLGSALGQSTGNLLEIVVAVLLLRRVGRHGMPLATVPRAAAVVASIAAGCAVSATVGTLSLSIGEVIALHSVPGIWRTWWLGDTTGALIVLPLAIAWLVDFRRGWLRGRMLEWTALLVTVTLLSLAGLADRDPVSYVVFPALIWAALRFGQRGATLATAIVAGFAIWGITHYEGPFAFHSLTRSLLNTQLYIVVAALSALALAAVVSEREALAMRLRRSRSRLVSAADTERRRIERDLHDGAQQRLVALAANLGMAAREAKANPRGSVSQFESAKDEVNETLTELRTLSHGIRPPLLLRLGPASAIEFAVGASRTPVEVDNQLEMRLDDRAEATAYFVAMEAIANAQKHARASKIAVKLAARSGRLTIDVVDDGVGGAVERPGTGLEGLRDRVEAIGGSFEIESRPTHGSSITAVIPCVPRPEALAPSPRSESWR